VGCRFKRHIVSELLGFDVVGGARTVVAGVALENDGGCAEEVGELAVNGAGDPGAFATEETSGALADEDGFGDGPGLGEVAGEEDDFGRERGGDHAEATTDGGGLELDGGAGGCVAVGGAEAEFVEVDGVGLGGALGVVAKGCGGGAEDLPTAVATAAALGAGGVVADVAELAGEAEVAGDEVAVGEEGGTDAFGDGEEDGVTNAVEVTEPELGEEAGVGVVFELDAELELGLDGTDDVEVEPVEVGGEHEVAGGGVYAAGEAEADAFEGAVGVLVAEVEESGGEVAHASGGAGGDGDGGVREDAAVDVDGGDDGSAKVDVGDEHGEFVIEGDLGGTATAGGFDGFAFADPAFFKELLDDRGDGAVLEAGAAGEVDASYGLEFANELEDDVAIDFAGELGGGDLHVGEVANDAMGGCFGGGFGRDFSCQCVPSRSRSIANRLQTAKFGAPNLTSL
jgi:hypothetical protein